MITQRQNRLVLQCFLAFPCRQRRHSILPRFHVISPPHLSATAARAISTRPQSLAAPFSRDRQMPVAKTHPSRWQEPPRSRAIGTARQGEDCSPGSLVAIVIFHILAAISQILLAAPLRPGSDNLLPGISLPWRRLALFRRSAKAFPFWFPSTRFWPT